ncbi:MAG: PEP-CTERM sorting domain-containing protein [Pseudomonadota bacterium]
MKKLLQGVLLSGLLSVGTAQAAPIQFDVIDVYTSVSAYYELADGSDSGSLFEVIHGAESASIDRSFDLGLLSGSQLGSIIAHESLGTIEASGQSTTHLDSLDTGVGTSYEPNYFGNWGKHVVVGSFIVPDLGDLMTEIMLGVDVISSNDGQALFWIGQSSDFNPTKFLANGYTPWGGLSDDVTFNYFFSPGETIYFAFGLEPGVGGAGRYKNPLDNSDGMDVDFSLYTNAASTVPEPSSILLMLAGLGLVGMRYNSKRPS